MAQTTISLKNTAIPVKTIILRDLIDCVIPSSNTVLISDSNSYDSIKWSKELYNAISNDEIIINIDGTDLSKDESLIYMQDVTITGGIANNYRGRSAIDPVGTFIGGETYFNTVLNTTMEYDPSRNKWLSQGSFVYGFSRNGNTASGSYFNMSGGILMNPNTTGYLTFANATLVGIQLSRTDVDAVTVEIMENLTVLDEIQLLANVSTNSISANVDITNPAILTARVKPLTNTITDGAGSFIIKLRA